MIASLNDGGSGPRGLRRLEVWAACAVALLLLAPAAGAQQPSPAPGALHKIGSGSIHGVVLDREGTVCEGAHVALSQTGASAMPAQSAISASDGRFVFGDLAPGAFQITVSSDGFAPQVVSGLLHPGESFEAPPLVLLVTAANSEVQVTASRQEVAQEQLKEQEEQRVLGFIPNFYVSYAPDAPALTARQKFDLSWKSSIDRFTLLSTLASAGIEQAGNDFKGYGQGSEGYTKRLAANYADNVIGTMIGSAILPSLLKQDPRYFFKGTGSRRSRILYAIESSVMCRSDAGRWEPNYSGIAASFASAGISNLYYPAADRSRISVTITNILVGKAEGAGQNIFQEFFVRRLTPKIPIYSPSQP